MTRRRLSTKTRMSILERFNRRCQMCQCEIGHGIGFDLDHRIPLAIGGADEIENLVPLCTPCHRLKTKGDVRDIAKARRREAKHIGAHVPKGTLKSRGFAKAEPQRRATRPLSKWFGFSRPTTTDAMEG